MARSLDSGVEHLHDEKASDVEMFFFARFHARSGNEQAVEEALLDVLGPSRQEPGCLSIDAFRSIHDPRLFYIHSRWKDAAAFDIHAGLVHTVGFIERVEPLIDHPLELTRAEKLG
jgi:quinol monooxygenase YgiN